MMRPDLQTVEFWEKIVTCARKKKLRRYDEIAMLLAKAWTGEEPFMAKVCMWLCGICCCTPCIYKKIKNDDLRVNQAHILRAWRLMGLHEIPDFLTLLESLLVILKKHPDILWQIDNSVVMQGGLAMNDAPFLSLEKTLNEDDLIVVKVCTYIVAFQKCTMFPYHYMELKKEIHRAIQQYMS